MVSSPITTLLLAVMGCILVLAAPTTPVDATTLLKNGQEAQKQNIAFQAMKETDPCTNEDKACMSGGVAVCRNSKWDVAQGGCSKTQACFAMPSVREAGTLVTCTSEKNALSAIEATGTTGGIFGNSTTTGGDQIGNKDSSPTSKDNSTDSTCDDEGDGNAGESDNDAGGEDDSPTSTSSTARTSTPSSTSKPTVSSSVESKSTSLPATITNAGTVTVTVTLGDQPTTLAPVTRTLSPEEASSVLSTLIAHGATVIESPPSTTAVVTFSSVAPTITSIPTSAPVPPSSGPSSTIILTASPSASNTVPAAAQSTNSSSGSGGYVSGY